MVRQYTIMMSAVVRFAPPKNGAWPSLASIIAQPRPLRSATKAEAGLPSLPRASTSCIISVVMKVPLDEWNQNRWSAKSGSSGLGASRPPP